MKLGIYLNNIKQSIAEINGKGHLGAHINLRPTDSGVKASAVISGIETSNPELTEFKKWGPFEANSKDRIEIVICPDEELDPPNTISSSQSELKFNHVSEADALTILK